MHIEIQKITLLFGILHGARKGIHATYIPRRATILFKLIIHLLSTMCLKALAEFIAGLSSINVPAPEKKSYKNIWF